MEKKQFVALLYIFGIVPMMYALSSHFLSSLWWVGFGWLNSIALIVFAILFTPNNTPTTNKKRRISLVVLVLLLSVTAIGGTVIKFSNKASTRLYSNVLAPSPMTGETIDISTTGMTLSWSTWANISIKIFTGDINTITDQWSNSGVEIAKPDYTRPSTNSGVNSVDTFQKPDTNPTSTQASTIVKQPTTSTTVLPSRWTLNYAQVIPYLVSKYNLKNTSKSISFKNITTDNSLYNAFNIAANRGMIGADINPASKVSCNTYMVLKGIAAGRKVDYKSGDPFGPYRTAAFNRSEVNGCTAGAFVTKATL